MKNKVKKCPLCHKVLKIAGEREYETLSEHVSDPNRTFPPKPYWECTCEESQNVFWGVDGDMYGDFELYWEIKKSMRLPNSYHASWKTKLIGSWGREYARNEYYKEMLNLNPIIKLYHKYIKHPLYHIKKFFRDNRSYNNCILKILEGETILDNQNYEVIKMLEDELMGFSVKRKLNQDHSKWIIEIKAKESE